MPINLTNASDRAPATNKGRVSADNGTREPAISLKSVAKLYQTHDGPVHALAPVNVQVSVGEMVVILGPSGCGKTTLLRIVGGLIKPSAGSVRICGCDLWRNDVRQGDAVSSLGMVFQDANLFPWLSIENNVTLPLSLRRVSKTTRRQRARELLHLVGISGFEARWPHELSGGMRQRAAIARALSYDPGILLMDEPFGALDALTRDAMNLELQRIWMETHKTVVLVTHSISEAVFLADWVALLSPRPGKVDTIIEVPFERPRSLDIQATARFQSIVMQLRHRLTEVLTRGGND